MERFNILKLFGLFGILFFVGSVCADRLKEKKISKKIISRSAPKEVNITLNFGDQNILNKVWQICYRKPPKYQNVYVTTLEPKNLGDEFTIEIPPDADDFFGMVADNRCDYQGQLKVSDYFEVERPFSSKYGISNCQRERLFYDEYVMMCSATLPVK